MQTKNVTLLETDQQFRANLVIEAFREFIDQLDGMTAKGPYRFHFDKVGQYTATSKKKLETDLRMVLAALTDVMNSFELINHAAVKQESGTKIESIVRELMNENAAVASLIEADARFEEIAVQFEELGIELRGFRDQPMTSLSRTEILERPGVFRSHVFISQQEDREVGMNITDYGFHLYLANRHGKNLENRWRHLTHDAWRNADRNEITNRYKLVKGFAAKKLLERITELQASGELAQDADPLGMSSIRSSAESVEKLAKNWLSETESRVAKWMNVAPRAILHKAELDQFVIHCRNAVNSRGTILPRVVKEVIDDTQRFIEEVRAINNGRVTHERDSVTLRLRQEELMHGFGDDGAAPSQRRAMAAGLVVQDYLEYTIGRLYGLSVGVASNLAASRATQKIDPFVLLHQTRREKTIKRVQMAFGDALSALAMSKRYQNVVLDLLNTARDEGHPVNVTQSSRTIEGQIDIGSWINDEFARIISVSQARHMQPLTSWQGRLGMEDGFKYVAAHSAVIDPENYWAVEAHEGRTLDYQQVRMHFGTTVSVADFDAFIDAEDVNVFYP